MTELAKHLEREALPKVQLGRTDMRISRVGFGAWAIGGPDWAVGWGPQSDNQSIAAIRRALQRGINWIDTAAVYGLGHSEELVGRVLKSTPASERPYVFTKCGLTWDENNRSAAPREVGSPASIRHEVEQSLRRLGVERIDLYQMHWPAEDGTRLADYWRTLLDLKAQGKVRAVGVSNHDVRQLEEAEALGHVDTLQPPFSAINREVGNAELSWCLAHGTGVIVYSPMQSGLLTGTFSVRRARALPASDWRSRASDFRGKRLEQNLKFVETLRAVAERHQTRTASVAIAWTLAWPGVTGAIVGARSAAQVDDWIDAATLTLTKQDLDQIAVAIDDTGAGHGPTRPAS
jgi:aryl-alcohol dehydrogenase-like predicted oxidoreductase